jgi:hypothetical protein
MLKSTSTSNVSLTRKLRSEKPGLTATNPSRLGDIAEHWVGLLAAWKGAEVYRNLNCTGKTDIVLILPDGNSYQIDVKLARPNRHGSWYGNTNVVQDPVIPVLVIPKGDITDWRVTWIRNRYPKELMHFWDRSPHPFTYIQPNDEPQAHN